MHYFSSDADNNGDRSYTRFGFKGETQIGDALTGYGQWEYQAGLDQPESAGPGDSYTRLGFAGLAFGHWGNLDYGRNYGLLYDVAGWTDVLPEFGNDSYEAADNFMTGRANGLLTYHNRSLGGLVDGLDLGLQYQGRIGDDAQRAKDIQTQNGDGYAFSATYDTGVGLNVGAAYANSARTLAQQRFGLADGDRARAWTLGLKYDQDNLYLAASYARTENMTYVDGDRYAGFAPAQTLLRRSRSITRFRRYALAGLPANARPQPARHWRRRSGQIPGSGAELQLQRQHVDLRGVQTQPAATAERCRRRRRRHRRNRHHVSVLIPIPAGGRSPAGS